MVLDGPQRLRGQIVSPFSMVLSIRVCFDLLYLHFVASESVRS